MSEVVQTRMTADDIQQTMSASHYLGMSSAAKDPGGRGFACRKMAYHLNGMGFAIKNANNLDGYIESWAIP